jgi:hypothetical protein
MAGSAREEAERLVATFLARAAAGGLGAAASASRASGDSGGTRESTDPLKVLGESVAGIAGMLHSSGGWATGSPECCVCPVCKVISAVRDPSPETAEKLATSAGEIATGVAGLMRAFSSMTAEKPKPAPAPRSPANPDTVWKAATRPAAGDEARPSSSAAPGGATRHDSAAAGGGATAGSGATVGSDKSEISDLSGGGDSWAVATAESAREAAREAAVAAKARAAAAEEAVARAVAAAKAAREESARRQAARAEAEPAAAAPGAGGTWAAATRADSAWATATRSDSAWAAATRADADAPTAAARAESAAGAHTDSAAGAHAESAATTAGGEGGRFGRTPEVWASAVAQTEAAAEAVAGAEAAAIARDVAGAEASEGDADRPRSVDHVLGAEAPEDREGAGPGDGARGSDAV